MRIFRALLVAAVVAALTLGLTGPASAAPQLPPTGTDWDYQLGGPAATPDHVGIVVRDRMAKPAPDRYNICYVNAFQTQPDERKFWQKRKKLVLRRGGKPVVDSKWNEWLLDVRTHRKRTKLTRIVKGWVDKCAKKGYRGVEFDNLDSYTRSKGLLKRKHNLAYAERIVRKAHQAGLAVAQKNLAEVDGSGLGFDFAIAESCARWKECGRYVKYYGPHVLMVEYSKQDFTRGCGQYRDSHPIVRRDLALKPSYGGRRWC